MKYSISKFLIALMIIAYSSQVWADENSTATPTPPKFPISLHDPNFQIIYTVSNPQNTVQIHVLTATEYRSDMKFCGGIFDITNCFLFKETQAETQLIEEAIISSGVQKYAVLDDPFNIISVNIHSLEFISEQIITFKTRASDAGEVWTEIFCLSLAGGIVEKVEFQHRSYNDVTNIETYEVDTNLSARCAPVFFPHKIFKFKDKHIY